MPIFAAEIKSNEASEGNTLDIGGQSYRLLCVDNVVPTHSATHHGARPRLRYTEGEVVHFELNGHRYVLAAATPRATHHSSATVTDLHGAPPRVQDLLTERELQIVQLVCMGYLTKQIADRLHISEFTVRSYLKTVYCKLGVRSRGAMVYRYAQAFQLRGQET